MTMDAVSFEWAGIGQEKHRRLSIPLDNKKKNRLIDLLYDGLERATGCEVVLQNKEKEKEVNRIGFLQPVETPKKRGRPKKVK